MVKKWLFQLAYYLTNLRTCKHCSKYVQIMDASGYINVTLSFCRQPSMTNLTLRLPSTSQQVLSSNSPTDSSPTPNSMLTSPPIHALTSQFIQKVVSSNHTAEMAHLLKSYFVPLNIKRTGVVSW